MLTTGSGEEAAQKLFARIPPSERPRDLAGVDALVHPVARFAVETGVSPERDP